MTAFYFYFAQSDGQWGLKLQISDKNNKRHCLHLRETLIYVLLKGVECDRKVSLHTDLIKVNAIGLDIGINKIFGLIWHGHI